MEKRMKAKILFIATIVATQFTLTNAQTADQGFQLSAELGVLNSESSFNSVINGLKDAQIKAKTSNAPIAKVNFNWNFLEHASLNLSAMHNIGDKGSSIKSSVLDNFMISNNTNSKLQKAYAVDLNFGYAFLERDALALSAIVGLQQDFFNWKAQGGTLRFNQGKNLNIRNDVKLYNFEQKYSSAYVGLLGQYKVNQFEMSSAIKFSPYVNTKVTLNNFYASSQDFNFSLDKAKHYGFMLNTAYEVVPNLKVFGEYNWDKFSRASDEVDSRVNGKKVENSVKSDNQNSSITAGLKYSF